MKIYKAYTNEDLLNHLRGSKEVINGLTDFDLDDEQLEVVNRFKKLSQFERDLLYLYSQHNVDIKESSPTPQFKIVNYFLLSLL